MEKQTQKEVEAQGAKAERKPSALTMYKSARGLYEKMKKDGGYSAEIVSKQQDVVLELKKKVLEEM